MKVATPCKKCLGYGICHMQKRRNCKKDCLHFNAKEEITVTFDKKKNSFDFSRHSL